MKHTKVPLGKKFITQQLLKLSDAFVTGMEESSYSEKKISLAYATFLLELAKRELQ